MTHVLPVHACMFRGAATAVVLYQTQRQGDDMRTLIEMGGHISRIRYVMHVVVLGMSRQTVMSLQ
jgi:hypothetical protein